MGRGMGDGGVDGGVRGGMGRGEACDVRQEGPSRRRAIRRRAPGGCRNGACHRVRGAGARTCVNTFLSLPGPAAAQAACSCIESACRRLPFSEALEAAAERLLTSLAPNLQHQHSRVRLAAIQVGGLGCWLLGHRAWLNVSLAFAHIYISTRPSRLS